MRGSDALTMAFSAIRAHKLRSALTLVGIIAGVASIIAVMTGISVIQKTMEAELSVLGTRTFQVQKWPAGNFGPHNDVDWRAIQRRAPITVEQTETVRERVVTADLVGAELWQFGVTARYKGEDTGPNLWVVGGTPEYPENNTHFVDLGRNISNIDVRVGRRVAVIGHAVAETLFPYLDPLGQTIKVDGHKLQVVGVFAEKKAFMGGNFDNYILTPVTVFSRIYGLRDGGGNPRSVNMTVRAASTDLVPSAIEETRAVMRGARGVDPRDEDDFSLYTNDSQIRSFNTATAGVKVGAFVIGIIALIVAGIGIMNIMLVSVGERTHEIGLRMAVGARRRDVLLQFLLEAIVLCNLGGVVGVAVGIGLGNITAAVTGFAVSIPLDWALRGLLFCTIVGLTFGLWPAIKASRLAPIDALRSE